MVPFTYTLAGCVVEILHQQAQVYRNDPGRPIPAEIMHLTGLTDDDVRGERIAPSPTLRPAGGKTVIEHL